MSDIDVHIGKVVINPGNYNLAANGVGSCLIITLYDSKLRIGALAHSLLPSSVRHNTDYEQNLSAPASSNKQGCMVAERSTVKTEDTKYIDVAIDKMLKGLEAAGAKRADLEAKLIGGANMFSSFITDDIGGENVLIAKDKLKREGIRIVGECVGGSQGRSIEFSPATGIVTVKTKF
jgi:chemotaxis protein CheD